MTLTIFGVRVLHFSALVGVGWALAFSSLGHDCLAKARIVGYSVGCRLWLLCCWVPRAAPSPAGRLPAGDGAYEVVRAASSAVNLPLTCSSGASSSRSDSSRHAVAEEYVLPAVSPGKKLSALRGDGVRFFSGERTTVFCLGLHLSQGYESLLG